MKKIVLIIVLFSAGVCCVKAQNVTKIEFNKTLKAYFDLKNALATDNVNLAGMGAKSLLTSLKTFPVKALTATQQAEWNKQTGELQKYADPIVMEKEIKSQRKSFEGVAYAMIKLVKAVGLNNNELYVQYCPMVKKSWLNETEDIQNPFYGSKMYDCGEITETLTKK